MNDHVFADDVGLDDPGLVVLGRDHVDVVLEDLRLQLVLGLCPERGPGFRQRYFNFSQFKWPSFSFFSGL